MAFYYRGGGGGGGLSGKHRGVALFFYNSYFFIDHFIKHMHDKQVLDYIEVQHLIAA